MKSFKYIFSVCVIIMIVSCTKELDVDYKTIEPFYIIQGQITDQPAKVLLTKSRNVNEKDAGTGVAEAVMELSDDLGKSEILEYREDGYYHSPSGWSGETGRTYTLKAKIAGKEYSATSVMKPAVTLDSVDFMWVSSAGMKMLLMKCSHTYPKGDDLSHIYINVTKNGKFYRTHTEKQINPDKLNSAALLGCTTEKVMQEDEPEKQDAILHEGDKMHIELWAIDKNVFDYFFSLRSSQQNASNPLSNFSNGVTGYFSAHHASSIDLTFSFKDIKE